MTGFQHTPFYCEENAWHLCQHPRLSAYERRVVFISNTSRCCPFWFQRASPKLGDPIFWDYHVLVIAQHNPTQPWRVWDLDTLLTLPLALPTYLNNTFGPPSLVPPNFHPLFRVLTPEVFLNHFSSDRSHMRTDDAAWREPPPSWPPLVDEQGTMNLMRFVDMEDAFVGQVMDRQTLLERFG